MRPDKYDEMVDACAHLPQHIWNEVRHLPMPLALHTGEDLLQKENNERFAKENFIELMWEVAFIAMVLVAVFFILAPF